MTQVKSLYFDSTGADEDYLKVVTDEGTSLLFTDERGDVASVLKDLEDGLFEDLGWTDNAMDISAWDKDHPNAVLIYGE